MSKIILEKEDRKITIKLSHSRQDDEFAVCLIRAPDLPGKAGDVVESKFGCNLAVVACNDLANKGSWSWCYLEADEKKVIGMKLVEVDAELDDWHYCLMYIEDVSI